LGSRRSQPPPNKPLQLTPNSAVQPIRGSILAAGVPAQRWRSARFGAAERRSVRRQSPDGARIDVTLFEYLAIAYSLVLSLTAIRLLGGLPYAPLVDRRYWVHFAWVCVVLHLTIVVFWLFWSYRDLPWNYLRFVLVLMNPGLLYLMASTLVPEDPAAVESWRIHFYSNRVRFFIQVFCWQLLGIVISSLILEIPLSHPMRFGQILVLVLALVGASVSRPMTDAILVSIVLAISALGFGLLLQPGSLAPASP